MVPLTVARASGCWSSIAILSVVEARTGTVSSSAGVVGVVIESETDEGSEVDDDVFENERRVSPAPSSAASSPLCPCAWPLAETAAAVASAFAPREAMAGSAGTVVAWEAASALIGSGLWGSGMYSLDPTNLCCVEGDGEDAAVGVGAQRPHCRAHSHTPTPTLTSYPGS